MNGSWPQGLKCALGVVCCVLLAVACGGGGGSSRPQPTDEEEQPTSLLHIVNAVPDAPSLLADLDGLFIGIAGYGETSVDYATPQTGAIELDVVYANTTAQYESLIDAVPVDLGDERDIYLVVSGSFAAPIATVIDNPKVILATDAQGEPVPISTLGVQFANSATLGESLDIYLSEFGAAIDTLTPTATLDLGEFSPQETVSAEDDYQIRITRAGATTPIYDSGQISLESARNQIFLLIDYFGPGDSLLRVVSIADGRSSTLANVGLPAELRIANFVAGAPEIDLYFGNTNDAPEFDNVTFGTFSAYLPFDAGTYPLNVTPANDNITFLYERNLAFAAGESRSLVLAGDAAGTEPVDAVFVREEKRPIATQLRLRFIHAAEDAGAVDFYVLEPDESLDDAAPQVAGAEYLSDALTAVTLGTYDLIVTVEDETTLVAGPLRQAVDVAAYTAVLASSAGGGPPYSLVVIEDTVQ